MPIDTVARIQCDNRECGEVTYIPVAFFTVQRLWAKGWSIVPRADGKSPSVFCPDCVGTEVLSFDEDEHSGEELI